MGVITFDDKLISEDSIWESMTRRDKIAKEAEQLIGRYLQVTAADSYAYYVITDVVGDMAQLDHIIYMDAWTVDIIESMDRKIPVKYCVENIEHRERVASLFADRD